MDNSNVLNGKSSNHYQHEREFDCTAESEAAEWDRTEREIGDMDEQQESPYVTDSEGEDDFINRYGEVNFQYIKKPRDAVWFIKPHALNYFKDGILYRTKGERSSSRLELFLDLMYVGIIANLAGSASDDASGKALLKYVLLFIPAWQVWADIKDFTNYYYNEDLSQKVYIIWILVLLTLYTNSDGGVLESHKNTALVVVPYILCRFSLAISVFFYSFWIPEHRAQQRLYFVLIIITCCIWIPVIFISTRAKIGLAFANIFLEQISYIIVFHPKTKQLMRLTSSTALNLEHEVERFNVFVTIAIGEFPYKVVASGPLGAGFSEKFARGVFLLIIAYCLFWIYNNGSTAKKATHPLRHSAWTAIGFMYVHIPMVASIVLAADAGGELASLELTTLTKSSYAAIEGEETEVQMYALSLFFTGGICVALSSMFAYGLLDRPKDDERYIFPRFWRIFWRLPVGVIILCLSFADLNSTQVMGITAILVCVVLIYESVVSTPKSCLSFTRHNQN